MSSPISSPVAPKIEQALLVKNESQPPAGDTVQNKTENVSQQKLVKPVQIDATKCWTCKRKVGLLGFKCRCSYVFCSKHRYSDQHDCDHDYKKAHQERLKIENPKIETQKIVKI